LSLSLLVAQAAKTPARSGAVYSGARREAINYPLAGASCGSGVAAKHDAVVKLDRSRGLG
jgi:hypothetical protein